jgi:hypothetical protein
MAEEGDHAAAFATEFANSFEIAIATRLKSAQPLIARRDYRLSRLRPAGARISARSQETAEGPSVKTRVGTPNNRPICASGARSS